MGAKVPPVRLVLNQERSRVYVTQQKTGLIVSQTRKRRLGTASAAWLQSNHTVTIWDSRQVDLSGSRIHPFFARGGLGVSPFPKMVFIHSVMSPNRKLSSWNTGEPLDNNDTKGPKMVQQVKCLPCKPGVWFPEPMVERTDSIMKLSPNLHRGPLSG